MEKIQYRFVFNRKNQLNEKGEALVQLEALLNRKKAYFSTRIHLPLHSWNKKKEIVVNHPFADDLNSMLYEERNRIEALELAEWRRSGNMSIPTLRKLVRGNVLVGDFISFAKEVIRSSSRSKGTKGNLMTTLKRLQKFRKASNLKILLILLFENSSSTFATNILILRPSILKTYARWLTLPSTRVI